MISTMELANKNVSAYLEIDLYTVNIFCHLTGDRRN